MNRKQPLRRHTPLVAKTPLKVRQGADGSSTLRRRTPLKARSVKTARNYVKRRDLVAELFTEPTVCEVPWCTDTATDPHEPLTRARGGSILDRSNIRLICGAHHSEIHDHEPDWAYELAFLIHSWDGGAAA
ncbi:hypothetical protein ACGFNU_21650 [Spirillospora sp. NPDC048911]|uniref:hypothetical protein n=1 Tax=Spirillospora sp. NPDC048911 TaxID=3364527 RepID=UPI00371169ED